ncbi:MAG: hypothetical protein K0R39_4040 [Symbiobacteriaceae bacterium]|jgi:hypothetical protein|nr:hypothetical protein [Symbiobacteriaceae bacterium]
MAGSYKRSSKCFAVYDPAFFDPPLMEETPVRKVIAFLIAALLLGGCIDTSPPPKQETSDQGSQQQGAGIIAARLFGPGDPRVAVRGELADPASPWWQALQNPADGPAHFGQAPVHRVDLTYSPEEKLLTGEHGIVFTNTADEPVRHIYLIAEGRMRGDGAIADERWALSDLQVNGKAVTYRQEPVAASITLDPPLEPGESAVITFAFKARLPVRSSLVTGLMGPTTYGVDSLRYDGLKEAIATLWTGQQMDAMSEGALEPDLGFPSVRDVRITLPAGWRAAGAGTAIETKALADGRQQVRVVAAGTSFPFYATAALAETAREVNGVRLVIHHRQLQAAATRELLDIAATMLESHAAVLGPFPLRELEFMPIDPELLREDAMYEAGVVYLNEALYKPALYGPPPDVTDPWLRRVMSYTSDQIRVMAVGHEVAHGWWWELVRVDRAVSPWWYEGMTEATMIAVVEQVYGPEPAQNLRDRNVYQYQLNRLAGKEDTAGGLPLSDLTKAEEYRIMSYAKPALFYEMVRKQMGDEAFFAALRRYIEPRRFTAATDRGPVEELTRAPGVAELYQRWMLETHGDEDIGLLTEEQIRQRQLVP